MLCHKLPSKIRNKQVNNFEFCCKKENFKEKKTFKKKINCVIGWAIFTPIKRIDSAVMPKIGDILFWYYIIIIKIYITIKEFLYMYTKQLETFSTKKQDRPRRKLEGLNSQAITLCDQVSQWPNDEWGKEGLMRMAPYLPYSASV